MGLEEFPFERDKKQRTGLKGIAIRNEILPN